MPINYQNALDNGSFGAQRALIVTQWPGTVTSIKSADMPRLVDLKNLADGTYYARFTIAGLSVAYMHMKAAFAAGSVTVTAVTTYSLGTEDDATATTNKTYQSFTGTGALTTVTQQDSTLAASKGEEVAIVKIVVAGGASPTFSMAEINGTR